MHLLVIEDERALCETIVRSLRRLAYSVDYCYDGEKALELLGVERYDLVILDLNPVSYTHLGEHMAEVGVSGAASDLRAAHPVAQVLLLHHGEMCIRDS